MKVRRLTIQNVRSFLEPQTLDIDGDISILIGPNGGGKTNLLDALVVMLRRHMFASRWAAHVPTPENPERHEFRQNDSLNQLNLERHANAPKDMQQVVEIEVEVAKRDIENMSAMKADADKLLGLASRKYENLWLGESHTWNLDDISEGQRFIYRLINGSIESPASPPVKQFLQYLSNFEVDGAIRDEFELAPLSTPAIYLPVSRSGVGFSSSVRLPDFNSAEQKRQLDAIYSRSTPSLIPLAIGRMAEKFRLLLEKDRGTAQKEFYEDPNLLELSNVLKELGYEWTLVSRNPKRNEYDVALKKQGTTFSVSNASSGEREILTYLFAIFALNVRDALIVVDEPELHLHPKWQQTLLQLFVKLAKQTGNQFLLATHSPSFIAPDSIRFVTRTFSQNQKSQLVRLNSATLPNEKHLFNIVNSQNNERIFFADKVVLVEGLSDRIVFERMLDAQIATTTANQGIEIVEVGGKGLFGAYEAVLKASKIDYQVVADLDYLEQIGSPEIVGLFSLDEGEVKKDVLDNIKSLDGAALVSAINRAIEDGSWAGAEEIWSYIKSRRVKLRKNLDADDSNRLDKHIADLAQQGIFILKRGALEDYLPPGYHDKDMNKLIGLVKSEEFFSQLPVEPRRELEEIVSKLLSKS